MKYSLKFFTCFLCKMQVRTFANGFVALLVRQNQHILKNSEKPLDKSVKML